MPTQPAPHHHREIAESFGVDAERYHRTRPHYPAALIERIVAGSPGRDVLDVGIGTGIVARQLRDAGCRVLGVEPDPRMASLARRDGFPVEIATIEEWEPAGRTFDAVVAGQTWHWVDPVAGAAQAARVLRPGGRIVLFWNAGRPAPEVAAGFAAVFARAMPDSPMAAAYQDSGPAYAAFIDKAADALGGTGGFGSFSRWRFEWEQVYTRSAWLDQLPTQGLMTRLPAEKLAEVADGAGAAIDAVGGEFTMSFETVALAATRST